jgi:hypothetical protein
MKLFLTLATLVGFATAACPNSCSGHGTCDRYDACTCFLETPINVTHFDGLTIEMEWTGADCSRRTCPRGISWSMSSLGFRQGKATTPLKGANTDLVCSHQQERECSDQGLCDRATGLCSCFPGYTGSSCQRTACPDDCSGHGTCRSNRDFAYDWAIAKTTQIQSDKTGDKFTELFKETYFASYDDAWDTDMHYGCKCDAGYRGPSCALVECPSAADPLDDKCTATTAITDYQLQYDAPFGGKGWEEAYSLDKGAAGEQTDLSKSDYNRQYVLDSNGRKVYGCYGAMSGQDCSGRGICDYSSGTCKCFSGYAGTACEKVEEMA